MPEAKLKQHELTPRIESREAMLLAGSQQHYTEQNVADIPTQWSRLPFGKITKQIGRSGYGVFLNGASKGCDFDYFAGVEVSTLGGLPADFVRLTIPAQKYAIFPHQEHVSRIKNTIEAILTDWYPTAREIVATPGPNEPQMIEFYGEDFDPRSGIGTIEIWLPLSDEPAHGKHLSETGECK